MDRIEISMTFWPWVREYSFKLEFGDDWEEYREVCHVSGSSWIIWPYQSAICFVRNASQLDHYRLENVYVTWDLDYVPKRLDLKLITTFDGKSYYDKEWWSCGGQFFKTDMQTLCVAKGGTRYHCWLDKDCHPMQICVHNFMTVNLCRDLFPWE